MTLYHKSFDGIAFMRIDPRLAQGDGQLVINGVHSLQIRQQQPASSAGSHDHTVSLNIQFRPIPYRLRFLQHIHAIREFVELIFANGRKSRIFSGGFDRVLDDLLGQRRFCRPDCPDAATQVSVNMESDERARPAGDGTVGAPATGRAAVPAPREPETVEISAG